MQNIIQVVDLPGRQVIQADHFAAAMYKFTGSQEPINPAAPVMSTFFRAWGSTKE